MNARKSVYEGRREEERRYTPILYTPIQFPLTATSLWICSSVIVIHSKYFAVTDRLQSPANSLLSTTAYYIWKIEQYKSALHIFFLNSSILSVGSREGEAADLSRVGSYKRLSTEKVSLVFCNIFRIISTREIVSLPKMCRKTQVYLSWIAEKTKGVAPWKSIWNPSLWNREYSSRNRESH